MGRIFAIADNGTTNAPNLVEVDLTTWELTVGPSLLQYFVFGQDAAVVGGTFWTTAFDDYANYLLGFDTTTRALTTTLNCSHWPGPEFYFMTDIYPSAGGGLLVVGAYGSASPSLQSLFTVSQLDSASPTVAFLGNVSSGGAYSEDGALDPASGLLFQIAGQSDGPPIVFGNLTITSTIGQGAPSVVGEFPLGGPFGFPQFDPASGALFGLQLKQDAQGYHRSLTFLNNPASQAWNVSDKGDIGEGFFVVLEDGPKAFDAATGRAFYMVATGPFAEFDIVALNISTSPPTILETPGLCGFIGYCPQGFAWSP
jgi:hypothetical protein